MKTNLLQSKIALVTGAGHSKGIGWSTALALSAAGAKVVVTDIKSGAAELDQLVAEIAKNGGSASSAILDVTSETDATDCVRNTIAEYGQLNILVNNAGIGVGEADFLDNADNVWEASIRVNLMGAVNCCRAAIPQMQENGGGSIINIASAAGLRALPSMPAPYTTSKFAAVGLTKSLALEFGADGIRCNAICPGSVATQMRDRAMELLGATDEESIQQAEAEENAMISLGRAASAAEIADAVVYLASPAAQYITGVALPVDGGWYAGL